MCGEGKGGARVAIRSVLSDSRPLRSISVPASKRLDHQWHTGDIIACAGLTMLSGDRVTRTSVKGESKEHFYNKAAMLLSSLREIHSAN